MIDLHCDTLSALYETKKGTLMENDFDVDRNKLKKAGSVAQFFACYIDMSKIEGENKEEQGFSHVWNLLNLGKSEFEAAASDIVLTKSYEEYKDNLKNEKISAFLTVEEGGIIGNDISKLHKLYDVGARLVTLTWNFENSIGFPNSTDSTIMQKGLKKFGFQVVEEMNEMGMIIDVSHLSDGGFFDVLTHSKKPVIASHSSARALCSHQRNLTDEMIKALAEKGGIAGVNFYPLFLSGCDMASSETVAKHLKHMINVGGEDFVALGSDFDGFAPPLEDVKNIGQIETLFHTLKRNGISERQLEKLKITNAERIIKEIL